MRREIVKCSHDIMGHFSTDKTIQKISENYEFQGIKVYVRRYISCYIPCLHNKNSTGRKEGFLHSIDKSGRPFHTTH